MPDYVANEPGFYVPDRHLRAPELLIPGRKPVSTQVEVDWDNSITAELGFCMVASANRPINLVSNELLTVNGSVPFVEGGYYFNASTANYLEIPNRASNFDRKGGGDFTVFVSFASRGETSISPTIIARGEAASTEWMLRHFGSGPSTQLFPKRLDFYGDAGNVNAGAAGTFTITENEKVNLVCRVGYNAGSGVKIHTTDGNTPVSDTTGSFTPTSSKAISIGGSGENANRPFGGIIYAVYGFSRALSDRETDTLLHDPYSILKPRGT